MPLMKGITVRIDADLHAEIKAYLEENGMTMGEFITLAAQDELYPHPMELDPELQAEVDAHLEGSGMAVEEFISQAVQNELHPKIPEVEVNSMGKEPTRTLAFQVPESLFQRVKQYLERNKMTQRQFVIGLIEEELDKDEDLVRKAQETAHVEKEEAQDEGLSENGEAPVSEDSPEVEQGDEPEETAAVGDLEGGFDEQDEGELEQGLPEDEPDEMPDYEDEPGEEETGPDYPDELPEPDSKQDFAEIEDGDFSEEVEQNEPPDTFGNEEESSDLNENYPDRGYVEGELGAAVEVAPMPDFGEEDGPAFPEPDDEEEQDYGMSMGY